MYKGPEKESVWAEWKVKVWAGDLRWLHLLALRMMSFDWTQVLKGSFDYGIKSGL